MEVYFVLCVNGDVVDVKMDEITQTHYNSKQQIIMSYYCRLLRVIITDMIPNFSVI
jgi:hypothetical protein